MDPNGGPALSGSGGGTEQPHDAEMNNETETLRSNLEFMKGLISQIQGRGNEGLSEESFNVIKEIKQEMKNFAEVENKEEYRKGAKPKIKGKPKLKCESSSDESDFHSFSEDSDDDRRKIRKPYRTAKTKGKSKYKSKFSSGDDSSETSEEKDSESDHSGKKGEYKLMKKLIRTIDNRSTPPQADFDEDSGQNLSDYLKQFEKYCYQSFKGEKYLWIGELKKHLSGRTLTGFQSVYQVNDSYKGLKSKLLDWYKEETDIRRARAKKKFENAKCKKDESLYVFSTRLENLFKLAFPKKSHEYSQTLIYQFKHSVPKGMREIINAQVLRYKLKDKRIPWKVIQKCARLYDLETNLESKEREESSDDLKEITINLTNNERPSHHRNKNEPQSYQGNTYQPRYSNQSRGNYNPRNWIKPVRMPQPYNPRNFAPQTNRFRPPPPIDQSQLCDACGKIGHTSDKCRKLLKSCFLCGDKNHFIKDCPMKSDKVRDSNGFRQRRGGGAAQNSERASRSQSLSENNRNKQYQQRNASQQRMPANSRNDSQKPDNSHLN